MEEKTSSSKQHLTSSSHSLLFSRLPYPILRKKLKFVTEKYLKPKEGEMWIFPNWLKHQVYPFFGEGERRSMAMNWAVYDSEEGSNTVVINNQEELQAAEQDCLEDEE